MAFIQQHLFSVSRPHQRGRIGGNQESTCRSPQKPPAKRCLTRRRSAKRVKQRRASRRRVLMDVSWPGCAGAPSPNPLLRLRLTPPLLSHFLEPLILPSKPRPAFKTLSNWSKPLIWLVRAGRPAECSTAPPQQRLGGCSGLRARGGGAWLASAGEKEKKKKARPQKPEGHTWSVPR